MLPRGRNGLGKSTAAGGSAPGAGRRSGERNAKLSEQDWLELWAFGTSRDGLGLTPERFWRLTRREYAALRTVYEKAHQMGERSESSATASPDSWPTQSREDKKAHLMTALMMANARRAA